MRIRLPYHAGYQDAWFYNSGDAEFHPTANSAANSGSGQINNFNENIIWYPGDSAGQVTHTTAVMQVYFLR